MLRQIQLLTYRIESSVVKEISPRQFSPNELVHRMEEYSRHQFGSFIGLTSTNNLQSYNLQFAGVTYVDKTVVAYIDLQFRSRNQGDRNALDFFLNQSLFFGIHVPSGKIAIESPLNIVDSQVELRYFVENPNHLSYFNIVLGEIIRLIFDLKKRPSVDLEPIAFESKSLYQLFRTTKTTKITVSNLAGRNVPSYEEFKIFNPREDDDRIYRRIFEEDIKNGLNSIEYQTKENGDLRNIASAKLAARTGDVTQVAIVPKEGVHPITLGNDPTKGVGTTIQSSRKDAHIPFFDVLQVQYILEVFAQYIRKTLRGENYVG